MLCMSHFIKHNFVHFRPVLESNIIALAILDFGVNFDFLNGQNGKTI